MNKKYSYLIWNVRDLKEDSLYRNDWNYIHYKGKANNEIHDEWTFDEF